MAPDNILKKDVLAICNYFDKMKSSEESGTILV